MQILSYTDEIIQYIPAPYRPMTMALFRAVRESGLTDPFEVAAALYRWTDGRPSCLPIREGLARFFEEEAEK